MKRKMKKVEKLNLIPILDAVFIFIFFLLMSAQFVEIHEIRTDRPVVKDMSEKKDDKKPLNLTLKISKNKVAVVTGLEEKVQKTFEIDKNGEYLPKLNSFLGSIKGKHPKEQTIILKPTKSVKYIELVKIVDHSKWIVADNKAGAPLFKNIVFESN